jgi:uncharacterized protein (DUF433 family)
MATATLESVISIDPDVVSGAPVFSGTRVPVSALFENLKSGATIDEFLEWFPGVTREQVVTFLEIEENSFLSGRQR